MDLVSSGQVSKLLGGYYVYYNILNSEEANGLNYPRTSQLYQNAINRLTNLSLNVDFDDIYRQLMQQAENEASRERAALKNFFNVDINYQIMDDNFFKQLILAFNHTLQTKDVFERNLMRLKYDAKNGGQISAIDISKFFTSYFNQCFNKHSTDIVQQIYNPIINGADANSTIRNVLYQHLPTIVGEALSNMFLSKAFNYEFTDKQDNEVQDAYKELYNEVQSFLKLGQSSQLVKDICNNYNMDKMIDELATSLSKENNFSQKDIASKINPKDLFKQSVGGSGGKDLESIRSSMMRIIVDGLKGNPDVQISYGGAVQIGGQELKPDVITTLNFDISSVVSTINEAVQGKTITRMRNIQALEEVYNKMSGIGQNFIIYESDKNYSLTKAFKNRGGFSAGSATSLQELSSILTEIPNSTNVETLIGALLQFGEGAIGTPDQLNSLKLELAKALAYFLFDDFNTLVIENQPNDTNALHVFNLSGFVIPLSFFLYKSAQVLMNAERDTRDIFQINVKSPRVLYGEGTDEDKKHWNPEGWNKQSQYALSKTTVSLHFLSDFRQIMSSIF